MKPLEVPASGASSQVLPAAVVVSYRSSIEVLVSKNNEES